MKEETIIALLDKIDYTIRFVIKNRSVSYCLIVPESNELSLKDRKRLLVIAFRSSSVSKQVFFNKESESGMPYLISSIFL